MNNPDPKTALKKEKPFYDLNETIFEYQRKPPSLAAKNSKKSVFEHISEISPGYMQWEIFSENHKN
jgi:hypothetical protein